MRRAWRGPSEEDRRTYDPADVFEAGLRNHHVSNTAYPIAHARTWGPYRVARREHEHLIHDAWRGIDDLCLYAHVPFCETRCSFCEYTVVKPAEAGRADEYVNALLREFRFHRDALDTRTRRLHGFDIGGGTPSFLDAVHIEQIVDAARDAFRFADGSDISIETTPRIASDDGDKLVAYRKSGIDRVSMGVQVIQPDLLRILNRDANGVEHHLRARDNIRAAGFTRFNVDLMYGFADQSLESWEATLRHAIDLGPEYITLYRMRYKLTRISDQAQRVTLDHVRPMRQLASDLLSAHGYDANPGKTTYSKVPGDVGTSAYLHRRVVDGMPYLGLGLGAQTFTDTTISYNSGAVGKNLDPYLRDIEQGIAPLQDLYDLPLVQMAGKMAAVSFYFGEIDRHAFARKFGVELIDHYADEVAFVLERGLMEHTGRALSLTPEGVKNLSGVIALFFAPSIQRYLIERDPDAPDDMDRNRLQAVRVAGAPVHV